MRVCRNSPSSPFSHRGLETISDVGVSVGKNPRSWKSIPARGASLTFFRTSASQRDHLPPRLARNRSRDYETLSSRSLERVSHKCPEQAWIEKSICDALSSARRRLQQRRSPQDGSIDLARSTLTPPPHIEFSTFEIHEAGPASHKSPRVAKTRNEKQAPKSIEREAHASSRHLTSSREYSRFSDSVTRFF